MNLFQVIASVVGAAAAVGIYLVALSLFTTVEEQHQLICCIVKQDYDNGLGPAKYGPKTFDEWLHQDSLQSVTKDCGTMEICPAMLSSIGLFQAKAAQ